MVASEPRALRQTARCKALPVRNGDSLPSQSLAAASKSAASSGTSSNRSWQNLPNSPRAARRSWRLIVPTRSLRARAEENSATVQGPPLPGKLTPHRESRVQISQELGVHVVTLHQWLKAWRLQGDVVPASQKAPRAGGPPTSSRWCEEPVALRHGVLDTLPRRLSRTSTRNTRLLMRLQLWADRQGGWKVFDSSGGFRLPDGSVRSPDASLVRLDRWRSLSEAERDGFPALCPDPVVDLASPSDQPDVLRRKMASFIANGARLGGLLLPQLHTVEVWSSDASTQSTQFTTLREASRLEAGEEFSGLALDLEEIWTV